MSADTEHGTFRYANPATVHWGAGSVAEHLDAELVALGARRVFLVSTRSIGANPALLDPLRALLGGRLVGMYTEIGQHAPVLLVAAAAQCARSVAPDTLLSVGGGSPIDAAKAMAFSLATGLDLGAVDAAARAADLAPDPARTLPQLAIPTTLSAAEMSGGAGFTLADTGEKTGLAAAAIVPRVVFYDADLALHTPPRLWLGTGIRAVDHAVETLLHPGSHPIPDALALDALRRLKPALLQTRARPDDREARTEAQIGAWLSFSMPIQAGRGLSHTLGKRLGARHNIPHGETSCLLLPHVMRYQARVSTRQADRLTHVAQVLGVATDGLAAEDAALRAADAVANLVEGLGLPRHLAAFGVGEADLTEAAGPVATERDIPLADLLGILRAAM